MASTRSKNTPGNYAIEQSSYLRQLDNVIYKNGASGQALLPGKCGSMNLSYNYADVESYLLGIGSTNLVNPKADPVVQLKYIQSINIYDKPSVIIPSPFTPSSDQRPAFG